MGNRHYHTPVLGYFKLILTLILIFSFWLGNVLFITDLGGFREATAQTIIPNQVANQKLVGEVTYLDVNPLLEETLKKNQIDNSYNTILDLQSSLRIYRSKNYSSKAAIVMTKLALAYQNIDENMKAIAYWEQSIPYYRQQEDWQQMGKILIFEAYAYNKLGNVKRAIALSESVLQIGIIYNYEYLRSLALLNRALSYRLIGKYNQGITDGNNSLRVARKINKDQYQAAAFNNLGITYMDRAKLNSRRAEFARKSGDLVDADKWKRKSFTDNLQALNYLKNGLKKYRHNQDIISEIWILINSIKIEKRIQKNHVFSAKFQLALLLLERLRDSPKKVYTAIELAKLSPRLLDDRPWSVAQCSPSTADKSTLKLIQRAVTIAQRLQDLRATSFALGNLAHIYQCQGNYPSALHFIKQAERASSEIPESLYLWQWSTARILQVQGKSSSAIAKYESAINTLQNIRNSPWKSTFTQDIQTIYRQLISFKLSLVKNQNQSNLNSVINTIDNWRQTELQNYFGKGYNLKVANRQEVTLINTNQPTAFLFSIILEDRTAIIVSLPNGIKKLHWIELDSQKLQQEINQFRISLERHSDIIYRTGPAQRLYNQIIRPFQDDLESLSIATLIFVPDGILRTTPITALYDGEQFLFQKYAIAITPSLTLTSPFRSQRQYFKALVVGLNKKSRVNGQTYHALVNVKQEINQILRIIPGSKQLLNEHFTRDRLLQELGKSVYSIIHIATHGEFGIAPEENFLVTGNNQKLTIADIEQIIRRLKGKNTNIDLLTLTACETAVGNETSALGMAGVAIQAGVGSVLASLWSINDSSTATLVTKFYEEWQHHQLSKAEALQKAQQYLFASKKKYTHPYYWAPFILVGNWL